METYIAKLTRQQIEEKILTNPTIIDLRPYQLANYQGTPDLKLWFDKYNITEYPFWQNFLNACNNENPNGKPELIPSNLKIADIQNIDKIIIRTSDIGNSIPLTDKRCVDLILRNQNKDTIMFNQVGDTVITNNEIVWQADYYEYQTLKKLIITFRPDDYSAPLTSHAFKVKISIN